jgi:O-antigen/teichoic acid export membrane protein
MAGQRKAGAVLGYANIMTKNLVNLLYVPLLLHYLGQGNYGVFQMSNSVVVTLTILSAGFMGSYMRFYAHEKTLGSDESLKRLNGTYLVIYVALALLSLFLGGILIIFNDELFGRGLTQAELDLSRSLLVIMLANVIVSILTIPFQSFVVAKEHFVFQQTRQLLMNIATPFLAIALLNFGFGAIGVALAQLAVNVALLILIYRYSYVRLEMRFIFKKPVKKQYKDILIFSSWILLTQLCDILVNQAPNFLLGALTSAVIVAVFSIAVQIRNVFYSLSNVVASVYVPMINTLVAERNDNSQLTRIMSKIGRYQTILFCYLFGGFIVVGQFFIQKWAGTENAEAYQLAIAMILPIFIPMSQSAGLEIERAKNKHQFRGIVLLVTTSAGIALSIFLIPSLGFWAAAIGYITSIVIGNGIVMNLYYQVNLRLDMKFFWAQQLPILLSSAIITLLFIGANHTIPIKGWGSFLLYVVTYSLVFGLVLICGVLNSNEKQLIHKLTHLHK